MSIIVTSINVARAPGYGEDYSCNGIADDIVINQAIQQAIATGINSVTLRPGIYSLDNPIQLASGVTLRGFGPGQTKLTISPNFSSNNLYAIGCLGAEISATATALTVDAFQGGSLLTFLANADMGAVVKGDYLFLQSDGLWETTNLSGRTIGEFVEVLAVTATTITVSAYVRDNYLVADNARLIRFQFVEDITIQGIEMYQQQAYATRVGAVPTMIGLSRCKRFKISECYLHNNDGPAITIHNCLDGLVDSNKISNLTSISAQNYLGYACLIGGASERILVSKNTIGAVRHGIDAGVWKAQIGQLSTNHGVARAVTALGNIISGCTDAALSMHSECDGWAFLNNHVSRCNSAAINVRGRGASVIGNVVEWASQGINVGNPIFEAQGGSAAGSRVIGNSIRYMKALVSFGGTGTGILCSLTDNCIIKDNVITECDRAGIQLRLGTCFSIFDGNKMVDCNLSNNNINSADGISIDAGRSGSGATLTAAAGIVTVTRVGANISGIQVTRTVTISGATNAGNNGTFAILSSPTTDSFTFANGAAVTGDTVSYIIENSTDNIFERNTAVNNPVSRYARGNLGFMGSVIRDYGLNFTNMRNVYKDNAGSRMKTAGAAGIISTNGVAGLQINNVDITI